MAEPISDAGELQAHLGQTVDLRGRYEIWDLGPHRLMVDLPDGRVQALRQAVNLVLADGSVVRLWARPQAEMNALRGAIVVARGRLLAGSPPAPLAAPASVPTDAPSLLEIERIAPT